MIFQFPITDVFEIRENGITQVVVDKIKADKKKLAENIIDKMGEASAKAQLLSTPITSFGRLAYANHRLYLKIEDNKAIGYIKVGIKNLFYRDMSGNFKELQPLCVLDFYVHESVQRGGNGLKIFESMLSAEKIEPYKLAIDRPSKKFLCFLKKHYKLSNYISQGNNFVIFNEYFKEGKTPTSAPVKQIGHYGRNILASENQFKRIDSINSSKVEKYYDRFNYRYNSVNLSKPINETENRKLNQNNYNRNLRIEGLNNQMIKTYFPALTSNQAYGAFYNKK